MSEVTLESQLFDIIQDKEMPEYIKLAKVEMLVNLGVDVNVKSRGKSAVFLANECGVASVSEFLRENGGIEEKISDEEAVRLAEKIIEECDNEDIDAKVNVVKDLIEQGADVNAKDKDGMTALIVASRNGHREVVEMLISNGADVNAKDNSDWTALMRASIKGQSKIAELLIANGALVNSKGVDGCTALIAAAFDGCNEIVKLLLENGADVNARDSDDRTALIMAISQGYVDVGEMLIDNGAVVNAKDKTGKTAMSVAKDEEVRKAIINAVKKRNEKTGEKIIINDMGR